MLNLRGLLAVFTFFLKDRGFTAARYLVVTDGFTHPAITLFKLSISNGSVSHASELNIN